MSRVLRLGVAPGLLLAQTIVLAVAALVATATAATVGPPLFHEHVLRAGADPTSGTLAHVEEAFRSAGFITLTAALGAALLTAVLMTVLLGRRITRPLQSLAGAAHEVAAGRYDVRVRDIAAPTELSTVTRAFNQMTGDLDRTEQVRGRLLSDLGHELRTPLATMTAYLDAIDDGVAEPDPQTVAILREQVDRLTRLAQDMGAISRAEESVVTLRRERVDLVELVGSVSTPLRPTLAPGVHLEVDVPAGLAVHGDRSRLQQVLSNLLDNAVRHTTGGTVRVSATRAGAVVRIVVADTGDGILAEHLPHLFERFYRTDTARDRDRGGSGLGLAICRAVVRAHGGTIEASSAGLGHGSTFTITVPRA